MRAPTGGTSRPKPRYSTKGPTTAKPTGSRPSGNVSPVSGKPYVQAPRRKTAMDRIAIEKNQRTWKGAAHLADSAVTAVDAVVPVRAGARAMGGNADAADWIALASMIPVAKPLKAVSAGMKSASAGARAAAKGGQTVAQAVGRESEAAARAAVGAKAAPKPRTVRVPKTKPVEPKTKAAKERYWNEVVPAWNKANPNDKIKVPTSGPTVGKAATDTRAQVAASEASLSDAEKAAVAAGRRKAAQQSSKARGARTRAAKAADPNTPKAARTRSKTKEMPASAKPPVKAVRDADVRGMADRRTKALREDGPSRKDLGVKGRDKAASKATDERVANFEQRMAAVRQARNDGSLPSYETQELTGAGTVPTARPVRPSVKTEKQVAREGVDTERKTRGGMTRIDQGERAASVEAGGKQGRMPASSTPVTKSRVNALKKQHDPKGPNPLTASDDEFKALVQKYPPADREYLVQARNEYKANDRTAANVDRLMQQEGRNPGTGARTPAGSKGPDQVPMNATADRNLRAKNPRKGLGKGSQSKDKPGPNARDPKSEAKGSPSVRKPKPKGMVAAGRQSRADAPNLPRGGNLLRGRKGAPAGDGSTLWWSKNTTVGPGGSPRIPKDDVIPGSPAQKPPGAADKPKSAPKKVTPEPTGIGNVDRAASVANKNFLRQQLADAEAAGNAKEVARIQGMIDSLPATGKNAPKPKTPTPKKPTASKPKPAAEKPASKPRTSKPKAPAATKPATKPKAAPKPAKAADEADNVTPINKNKGKPKSTPKKPKAGAAKPAAATPRGRTTGRAPVSNPVFRNPRAARAEMAEDLLKGRGIKKSKTTKLAAASIVGVGAYAAYGRTKQRPGTSTATPKPPAKAPEKPKGDKPAGKKVFTEKDGDKYVLDRYGRRMSPAEYKRRLAEKKARENAKTPEERLRLYKQQVARRKAYRESQGTRKKYGKRAQTVRYQPKVKVGEMLRKAAKN